MSNEQFADYVKRFKKGNLDDIQADLTRHGLMINRSNTRTPAESEFGAALVDAGIQVFPQWKVGRYEFDFRIKGYPILLEIDGGIHRTPEKHLQDVRKDRAALIRGYRVVRFVNHESADYVVKTVQKVLSTIKKNPQEVWVVRETLWMRFRRWLSTW